ncbi:FAD binding domain protein [Lasiosphaeria miniovina]|uniref:FAD binding domain protein n=1 Tax=Lasiosphaeria miniovina TaxID=1954250 RepID=A0AA40AKR7_9PEZI|nr:FAD binding domain protein [Lasiosphaeria miniovina]KAK0717656.1 FAD binding domain protein [Lasiosphaeria miniovina]
MASQPKSVVIIGGSLAGLLHGLSLKRRGSNVVVLEQDQSTMRSGHEAGIAYGPGVGELLDKYDDTGVASHASAAATRIAFRKREDLKTVNLVRHLSSWVLLYRILRANFDGTASKAVPSPPPPRAGDGTAEYRAGKRVTGLAYDERAGFVTVRYVSRDGDGGEESVTADLVLAADGVHSTVRGLVNTPTAKEYSGYVSWRGTVPEKDLPPRTAAYFKNNATLDFLKRNYIVGYTIPGDAGGEDRLINFVWYFNYEEGSTELEEALTDIHGHRHANTVPVGLVQPAVWKRHLASALPAVAAPFAELISRAKTPFVTKVNDVFTERATYCGGRVVLVGDALATFRPHLALATEQAARHCLGLEKVWDGDKTLQEWEREVLTWGRKIWMGSRVLGIYGQGTWWQFFKIIGAYILLVLRLRWGKL